MIVTEEILICSLVPKRIRRFCEKVMIVYDKAPKFPSSWYVSEEILIQRPVKLLPDWVPTEEIMIRPLKGQFVELYKEICDLFPNEEPPVEIPPQRPPPNKIMLLVDPKDVRGTFICPLSVQRDPLYYDFRLHRRNPKRTISPGAFQRIYIPKEDYSSVYLESKLIIFFDITMNGFHYIARRFFHHPFMIIRHQLQLHANAEHLYLTPFSLLPIILYMYNRDGLLKHYRGFHSYITFRLFLIFFEMHVAHILFSPLRRRGLFMSEWYNIIKNVIVKWFAWFMVAPFYASSIIVMVQTDIITEKSFEGNIILRDVYSTGLRRLIPWKLPKGTLKIWAIVLPTAALGTYKYVARHVFETAFKILYKRYQFDNVKISYILKEPHLKYLIRRQNVDIYSHVFGHFMADALLFRRETVLLRCLLQGASVEIDDLDTFNGIVKLLNTTYVGVQDAYEKMVANEGPLVFYRGFGVMIMQYLCYIAFINLWRTCVVYKIVSEHRKLNTIPNPEEIDD